MFASWGAEEFGLIGSTEFTEVSEPHRAADGKELPGRGSAELRSPRPCRSSSARCRSARWPTSTWTSRCLVWGGAGRRGADRRGWVKEGARVRRVLSRSLPQPTLPFGRRGRPLYRVSSSPPPKRFREGEGLWVGGATRVGGAGASGGRTRGLESGYRG